MNPFVLFKIVGIKGLSVSDSKMFFSPDNNDKIETIEIIQEDKAIGGFRFILKENVNLDGKLVSFLTSTARRFIVNILGKCTPDVYKFSLEIKQIYDPKNVDDTSLMMHSSIGFACSLTLNIAKPIDAFKVLFEQTSPRIDADYYYSLLYNVITIDNIVTRYLMQYEILLSLVATKKREQKEVTEYIKTKYNPSLLFNTIGFCKTRRKVANPYDEDEITYYRNLLGHNDGSDKVTDKKISEMSMALTQVLFFALNNI